MIAPTPLWTVPNLLSAGRTLAALALAPAFLWLGPAGPWAALAIFLAAAITDGLDGWIARRLGQESALGRALDPIADKALTACALLALAAGTEWGGAWWFVPAATVILLRELVVAGLREAVGSAALAVTGAAKWKTALQMTALGLLFGAEALGAAAPKAAIWFLGGGAAMLWLAAALTAFTGWRYARRALAHLAETGQQGRRAEKMENTPHEL